MPSAAKPFLIASWCDPENAVNTSSPPYGWRACTGIRLHSSTVRTISGTSQRSSPGSTPCEYRLSASVTTSTLPVRSPFPNSVPSTRSAPAISASSVAATAVPRSLCGCTLKITDARSRRLRSIHSIWSAYTFGVAISTVAGRFRMIRSSGVGRHASITASQIALVKSSSVAENVSGEYSSRMCVWSATARARCAICSTARTATPTTPARSSPNTTRRNSGDVAL